MREILFKGFHECIDGDTFITVNGEKKRGRRIEGNLIKMDSSESCQTFIFPFYEGASTLTCNQLVRLGMIDVIPETVSQFTGLTDKNGNKIFENDSVYNGVFRAKVKFINGYFYPFSQDDICVFHNDECKIISNIFEHPEMLESEGK